MSGILHRRNKSGEGGSRITPRKKSVATNINHRLTEVIKDYDALDSSELSLRVGDKIEVLDIDDSGWAEGLVSSRRGWFPIGHVKDAQEFTRDSRDVERGSILGDKKQKSKGYLENFFRATRPPKEELEKRNILPKQSSDLPDHQTSPLVAAKQKELEKTNKKSMLNSFLRKSLNTQGHRRTPSSSQRKRKGSVFGVDFKAVISGTDVLYVPCFIVQCVEYLKANGMEEEGLFRISAGTQEIEELRGLCNLNGDPLPLEKYGPHVVAHLLKLYIRELPEPLFTYDLYDAFIATSNLKETQKRKETLQSLVDSLPEENRVFLNYLFEFLYEVTKHEAKNKMGAQNLSIVFTPNLIRAKVTKVENMMLSGAVSLVTQAIEKGGLKNLE